MHLLNTLRIPGDGSVMYNFLLQLELKLFQSICGQSELLYKNQSAGLLSTLKFEYLIKSQ